MYSGLVLTKHSGSWLGAHQRFNRFAYRIVLPEIDPEFFPDLKGIQHFEGKNGPDGLKRKSSGQAEPSHFYDPKAKAGDVKDEIKNHYKLLVNAIKKRDNVRAAFEASWLAHSITDGLTPAHHYPYGEHLIDVRDSSGHKIKKFRHKLYVKGINRKETLQRTWKLVGAKGVLSTHLHFELGVAAAVTARRMNFTLNRDELAQAHKLGAVDYFAKQAQLIAGFDMYGRFCKTGWTGTLARMVRRILAPTIAQTIAVVWLLAYQEAGHNLRSHRLQLVWA